MKEKKQIIYDWWGEPVIEVEDGILTALKDCTINLTGSVFIKDKKEEE